MATSLTGLTIFNNTDTATNGKNTIIREVGNVDANIANFNIPFTDIDTNIGVITPSTVNIKSRPKKRVNLIDGYFDGSASQCLAFVTELDNEVKSSTQSAKTYVNSIGFTITVSINNFTYTLTSESPYRVFYTLQIYTQSS